MAKNIKDLSKSLRDNLDLTAYSQVGHTHQYAGSSTVGGSATSAVKLATARAINGTNFDGTAAITTAKWGTARTLTIGNSGKSVDGSGNISWTLAEIGAVSQTDFDNLTIGGRNYVLDSKKESTTTSTYQTRNLSADAAADLAGKVVTFSFDLKGTTAGGNIYVYFRSSSGSINPVSQTIGAATTEYKRYSITFTAPTDLSTAVTAAVHTTSAIGTASLKNLKVELGHKATSWCYAIEDYTLDSELTTALAGKANSSHGTHVTYASATPSANGIAAVGSSSKVAREDHVHPLQTTVSGNAGSADKLTTARTITIGNKSNTFDGSANITYTLSEIGAAATSHTHNYAGSSSAGGAANSVANNLKIQLNGGSTEGTNLFTYNGSGAKSINITPSSIGAAASSHGTHVSYSTTTPKVAGTGAVGSESSVARGDHVHPAQTSVTGNAGTATTLQTARNIQIGNKTNSFNGSANITYSLSDIGALPTAGGTMTGNIKFTDVTSTTYPAKSATITWNGSTDGADIYYQVDASDKGRLVLNTRDDADCIIAFANKGTFVSTIDNSGNFSGKAATAGNADTATKLATGRSITIGNQAQTFDGSGNISFSVASIGAAASSHTHNYAGSSSAGGAANSVKTNLVIKLNNGGTEGTDLFTFNGSTAKTVNITPSGIGAAASSHGTHVTYSTSAPLVAGTAAVGSANNVARGDHVHPAQTSVSGNAGTATKLATARTIQIGNKSNTFDGSANITYTLSDIGAAPASHGQHAVYGTCETAAATAEKAITISGSGFSLAAGQMIAVKFTASNTASNVKFNVNSTGAKPIWYNNAEYTGNSNRVTGYANAIMTYVYNGSHWVWVSSGVDNNTTYSNVALGHGYATCDTAEATAAKVGTLSSYALTKGGIVAVKFSYAVPASATLNINSKGAKSIYFRNAAITANIIKAGDTATFIYDGTYYQLLSIDRWQNDITSHTHNYAGSSSAGGAANSAVKWSTARTLTIGSTGKSVDGSGNVSWSLTEIGAAASGHTHNQINSRGKTTCESGVTSRPAVAGLSMTEAYNNSYPIAYGNVINLRGQGDGQILVGWSGTDGAHAPVYVRSKRDNTSTANWSEWAQFYTTANKPTYSDVGAAASSHGTHVTYSTTAPKVAGTAAVGSESSVARGDHVHAAQTSVSGNAGTATKLQTGRTITIGNKANTFDGSANISYTLADIGAATSGHTHNYAGSSSAGGAANSAVKLSSARTINGTNFDGSANITTANWGTSRKINQISVNGSADVKLPLDYYTCNIGNSNAKPYHHILTTGQCTGNYTDKSITIVLVNHYNSAGLGIAKATLRTNNAADGATATGELRWLVRSGFAENQLCFNIRNTAKDAYMDVFYKSGGTYASLTWYVLTEGARGNHGSQWTKYTTHHDNGTNVYDETGMKAIRTYTATLQSATDHGSVNSAKTAAACSGNAATATKLATARNIKIGDATKSFDGSANVTFTLAEIGIGSSISAVASNLSGVTINGYDSMMTTINSNLGKL